ncbi:MAG: purine phosphoribosyltransferase family protein [Methanobacterium sp.]|uniref:hypoxanthine/guanine phosphoribosyltransferase n=1 Tax=Methanobacterium sp. TaxID=2164 RepID=UPI003D65E70B|nr:purine phosphoribosyltransferase family protein [Methanobacterium sp.]
MLDKLKKTLVKSPIVKKGEYDYFVHPITDGIFLVEPDLLREVSEGISKVADLNVDKIVCMESMGIHIATALSLKTDIPFVVVRKRHYGLDGEVAVHQVTGYSKGELYINGIKKGDRLLIVDDVLSTGGTMIAVLDALKTSEGEITDIVVVVEKGDGKARVKTETGYDVKTLVKVDVKDGEVVIEDSML